MKKQSALNCTPTPEGVAGLVSFLASDDSKFMTGSLTMVAVDLSTHHIARPNFDYRWGNMIRFKDF